MNEVERKNNEEKPVSKWVRILTASLANHRRRPDKGERNVIETDR